MFIELYIVVFKMVLKYNKQNINFKSLPYSTFELLHLCP